MEGFVLHNRRYRETSLLVELLTKNRGRITVIARGAFKKKSPLSELLHTQTRLSIQLTGKTDLQKLVSAEPIEGYKNIVGKALFPLLYVNELVSAFTLQNDPNPELYRSYLQFVRLLDRTEDIEAILRIFELDLLHAVGLSLNLEQVTGTLEKVKAEHDYKYVAGLGVVARAQPERGVPICGSCLLQLSNRKEISKVCLSESKRLLRYVLDYHLEGKKIKSRQLFLSSKKN